MVNLLVKKDTRIIDIGGGFIAEVYIEQMVEYTHKVYITHEDFTCAKYLISSVEESDSKIIFASSPLSVFVKMTTA